MKGEPLTYKFTKFNHAKMYEVESQMQQAYLLLWNDKVVLLRSSKSKTPAGHVTCLLLLHVNVYDIQWKTSSCTPLNHTGDF